MNTELFPPDDAIGVLRPLLDGSVPWNLSHEHLTTHHDLHRAARRMAAGGPLPDDQPWFDQLLRQIESDRASGVFGRWAESTAVDSNAGQAVLDHRVLERFSAVAGTPMRWPIANAGLTHTYGYLLAGVVTPYGWKRDRWVNGGVAQAFGVERQWLSPWPPEGTLLRNLTAVLDCLTLGCPAPEWLRGADLDVARLTEVDEEANLAAQTWIVSRSTAPSTALVYTLRERDDEFRNVTAFSFPRSGSAKIVTELMARTGPLELKYNAAAGGPSGTPARRRFETNPIRG